MDVYGADELIDDIEKLGLKDIILKSDGETALKVIQAEVKRRRGGKTILENSPVGDSRTNGDAERAVQSIAAHVRTLKKGLEDRGGFKLSSDHPIIPWLVQHAADVINKYRVGPDGKTAYERWKGKPCTKEAIESGELVHYKLAKRHDRGKLEDRWNEGIFLGMQWRTGEYMVSTADGVHNASTMRRTGEQRRWDSEKIWNLRGTPWQKTDVDQIERPTTIRWMTPEEKQTGVQPRGEELLRPRRVRLMKEDFFEHGFTVGCQGCKAIINHRAPQSHNEECRKRMEKILEQEPDGKDRKRKAEERDNEWLAEKLRKSADTSAEEEREKRPLEENGAMPASKKTKQEEERIKRASEDPQADHGKRYRAEEMHGTKRQREDARDANKNEMDMLDQIIDNLPIELNLMEAMPGTQRWQELHVR